MDEFTAKLIEGMHADFAPGRGEPELGLDRGHQPGTRPIHSSGISAVGWFRGTHAAARYCTAPQFGRSWTPVTVRFSNGNGAPDPDGVRQVRGMAVKFHLGETTCDGEGPHTTAHTTCGVLKSPAESDLVCMSVPMFMVKEAEGLLDFEKAYLPRAVRRPGLTKRLKAMASLIPLPTTDPGTLKSGNNGLIAYAQRTPEARAFIAANAMLGPPDSYGRTAYHAVHAFELEGECPDGLHQHGEICPGRQRHMGRFSLEPGDGVRLEYQDGDRPADGQRPLATLEDLEADYLKRELERRLDRFVSVFNLRMQLADPWDDTSDPTTVWPMTRKRVLMGSLVLHHIPSDQDAGCEKLSFNPGQLAPGMGLSDDPVLRARVAVYEQSQAHREAQTCPFAHRATGSAPLERSAPV
ncbi:MAG: catalase [Acidimicrobiales bacterium]|jgi:catalase